MAKVGWVKAKMAADRAKGMRLKASEDVVRVNGNRSIVLMIGDDRRVVALKKYVKLTWDIVNDAPIMCSKRLCSEGRDIFVDMRCGVVVTMRMDSGKMVTLRGDRYYFPKA